MLGSVSLDHLIENARIVNGTGAPWFRGAVGIRDGEIVSVERGRTADHDADERLDADGSVVCPLRISATLRNGFAIPNDCGDRSSKSLHGRGRAAPCSRSLRSREHQKAVLAPLAR